MVPDPARVARWEFLVQNTASYWPRQKAEAAMRLADEERAALVAEVERLRETSEHRAELLRDALRERDGKQDALVKLFASWRRVRDLANERLARAEAAEAKVAKVEADVCRFAKDAADVQTKWLAAEARSEAVEAALRRVRELHQRRGEDLPIEEDWCEADGRQWPCPTSAALSDPTPTVKDQS